MPAQRRHADADFFEREFPEAAAGRDGARSQSHRMQTRLLRLVEVFGFVGPSVKEAPHQAVTVLTDVANSADHAPQGHAQEHQRMRSEHQARFERLGDHFGGARGDQPVQVRVVERAHDHRQRRIDRPCVMQDAQRERSIGESDHERARPGRSGSDQGLVP